MQGSSVQLTREPNWTPVFRLQSPKRKKARKRKAAGARGPRKKAPALVPATAIRSPGTYAIKTLVCKFVILTILVKFTKSLKPLLR